MKWVGGCTHNKHLFSDEVKVFQFVTLYFHCKQILAHTMLTYDLLLFVFSKTYSPNLTEGEHVKANQMTR